MNKIVIVEDKLRKAVTLAEQFVEFSNEHPELGIDTPDICFFCPDPDTAQEDITQCDNYGFEIKHLTLLNFSEILDRYLYSDENKVFLIIDYLLDDDGSEGEPIRRVNIRYARNKERYKTNQLWFYTGTGPVNEKILGELFGKERILDVLESTETFLNLCLDNDNFRNALLSNQAVGV